MVDTITYTAEHGSNVFILDAHSEEMALKVLEVAAKNNSMVLFHTEHVRGKINDEILNNYTERIKNRFTQKAIDSSPDVKTTITTQKSRLNTVNTECKSNVNISHCIM